MKAYADTGFICSLYAPDAHTERAVRQMERGKDGVFLSWLNQVEFRNALRLRVFRKEITPAQRDASLNHFLADVNAGVWQAVEPAHEAVLTETERLSALYSEKIGARTLDILHVAMSIVLGSNRFLSFDKRQLKLAKAAGVAAPGL